MNEFRETFQNAIAIIVAWRKTGLGNLLAGIATIIILIVLARLVVVAMSRLTERILTPKAGVDPKRAFRVKTVLPILLSIQRYSIYFIAGAAVLKELGIDTSAILASAGVVGLAVGFGAQNLVKDSLAGFFLIFDDLIAVGDVVTIGVVTGMVERIDLRTTSVRELTGKLWSFPNGDIRAFGNLNRDFGRAVVEVGLTYEQDVEVGMRLMRKVGDAWAAEHADIVLEPPEVQGVQALADSAVMVRIMVKVKPLTQGDAQRELRLRIKAAFDAEGVEIPYPRQVIYERRKDGGKGEDTGLREAANRIGKENTGS